jgi:hypothetical protein
VIHADEGGVHMRVDEPGQQGAAAEIDDLGAWGLAGQNLVLGADGQNSSTSYGDGLRSALRRAHRPNWTVDENRLGAACSESWSRNASRREDRSQGCCAPENLPAIQAAKRSAHARVANQAHEICFLCSRSPER